MLTETANHVSPDMPEDGSMHESLTMEQFNSPLVSPQYKSTYAIVATSGEFYNMKSFAHSFERHWWNFFPNPLVIKPSIRLFPLLPRISKKMDILPFYSFSCYILSLLLYYYIKGIFEHIFRKRFGPSQADIFLYSLYSVYKFFLQSV